MSNLQANEFVTGECRLSYVNLLEAKAITAGNAPQFSLKMLIPKSDAKTMNDLRTAMEAAKKNGVSEGKAPFKNYSQELLNSIRVSLKDGDKDFPDNPECAGHWVLNAKTAADKAPGVLVKYPEGNERPRNPTDIYSGMYGRVHVQLFPYDTAGNRGIGVSLQNVLKTRDGDPLGGGRKRAEDVFGDEGPFGGGSGGSDPFN